MVRWDERSASQGPALLTMLGIGGTFFGIAFGLLHFNPNDVQGSIPGLIDGIRSAVWASFTGVVTAILLKTRMAFSRVSDISEAGSDVDILANQLAALQRAIAGDDESTIISQLKLGRSDMNDGFNTLRKSQADFMERLAEMSSKTLVEALRDVIRDFNTNLTEQFGDNFKELNSAVFKLVDWQDTYKRQLDDLIKIQEEAADAMSSAVVQYKEALVTTQTLREVAVEFSHILGGIDSYKASLRDNTERLAGLVQSMTTAVPVLENGIKELIATVSESVVNSEEAVERIAGEISARFAEAADAIKNDLTSSLSSANREINDNLSRLIGSTTEFTEQLQTGLETSLNTSLDTLSRQLISLSSRFAKDYGPIADHITSIVAASRNGEK